MYLDVLLVRLGRLVRVDEEILAATLPPAALRLGRAPKKTLKCALKLMQLTGESNLQLARQCVGALLRSAKRAKIENQRAEDSALCAMRRNLHKFRRARCSKDFPGSLVHNEESVHYKEQPKGVRPDALCKPEQKIIQTPLEETLNSGRRRSLPK